MYPPVVFFVFAQPLKLDQCEAHACLSCQALLDNRLLCPQESKHMSLPRPQSAAVYPNKNASNAW